MAVQEARLFADSKAFADADPRRAPAAILADYLRERPSGEALAQFVADNFVVPEETESMSVASMNDIEDHIAALWPKLTREPVAEHGSALGLPQRHVVPGGRFRELYYWDSYFTMLGLAAQGRLDLVEEMVDLFAGLIERFGHVPNGTRSYYLTRSQPPVFYLMVGLSRRRGDPRLLAAMRREHAYWMAGGRTVALPDGAILNLFWDDAATPRDESWIEDVATASASGRPEAEVWRDIRAAAESGWDFSSRWLGDGRTMETIRTTRIVPCCLNALLYGLEAALGGAGDAVMAAAADRRRAAMTRFLWNERQGFFADRSLDDDRVTDTPTAAMLYPLFAGCADAGQARATVAAVRQYLIAPGGLRTTLIASGQQWDSPNGWAPLQWIGCRALATYGESDLAADIARRWIETVAREFRARRRMLKKYDVERGGSGGGGEYATQEGFGWTNAVTVALMERFGSPMALRNGNS